VNLYEQHVPLLMPCLNPAINHLNQPLIHILTNQRTAFSFKKESKAIKLYQQTVFKIHDSVVYLV